ncbi:MAG: hypothetical protein QOI75_5576, partial [Pseudonocardiales bacterium]|nr:hypothetical protein [Pseudonocardiales bacterium]
MRAAAVRTGSIKVWPDPALDGYATD